MKTCVIFNPTARGGKAVRFREHLRNQPQGCTLKATSAAGDARRLATEAVREGFDVVVAAGGDGTVNEVANGIADAPGGLRKVRLAVIPLGTVNVFALELGIPSAPTRAWQVIAKGQESTIDLLKATFTENGEETTRHCVQLAGAGLDSMAISFVNWNQKKRLGQIAYIIAGLKALCVPKAQITVEAGSRRLSGQLVLIGNGQYYGGKFRIFPLAGYQDGLMDVSVFHRVTGTAIARCAWGLLTNRLHTSGGAGHIQSDTIVISSPTPIPFQLDGDNVGMLPVRFTVEPRALRVLHPPGSRAFQS